MKVLLLPESLYEYLVHVVRTHSSTGIEPDEGMAVYQLWQHVQGAQTVDVSDLGKAQLEKIGPDGVAIRLEPEQKNQPEEGRQPSDPS